jgi:hypothetical protein
VTTIATTKAASSSGQCDGLAAAAFDDGRYAAAAEVVQVASPYLLPVVDGRSRKVRAPPPSARPKLREKSCTDGHNSAQCR